MIRVLAAVALVAVIAVGAFLIFGNSPEDDGSYRVRAIFDNAGFVIPGEDVKIAGVRVGQIDSIDVTEDFRAAVVLKITEPGYTDWKQDASCIVRPQNLIGERFVECKPTQVRSANAEPPPELKLIEDGEGEGQRLLPVENTTQSVDIDLIGNTMREPERERFSLILNELGTGVAGRGRDLNEVIRRANPALRETDKVLEILARQNTVLEQLAVNSDTILAPLARDRARVSSAIRNSSDVAKATAERREALADDIETLPEFLDELDPTMVALGELADEGTPLLTDLGAQATDINNVVRRLGPFSQAAIPAIDSLGEAAKTGTPAVTDARPVIADLRALAKSIRPVGTNLREVLESFRDTEGIQRLMDYIYFQATAINGYDATGHYLRAGLLVNSCTTYAVRPVSGCNANYPQGATSSSLKAVASGVDGVGEDPLLRATAIAIARALGQQVEEEKAKIDSTLTTSKRQGRGRPEPRDRADHPRDRRRPRPPRRPWRRPAAARPRPLRRPPRRCPPPRRPGHRRPGRRRAHGRGARAHRHARPGGRPARLPVRKGRRRMRSRGGGIAGNPVLIGAATVLVILVAVFLSYNANKGLPFVPTYQVKAELPSAAQLTVGNDVKVGGTRIGAVTALKPRQLENGRVIAVVDLTLDKDAGPLPKDSTLIVRPRSALGLKYVEITRGKSSASFQDGDTIPIARAETPVELDEFLNMFDEDTRSASQVNLEGFGTAFAGRGESINTAIGAFRPLLRDVIPVMQNLSDPRTNLERFVVETGDTAAIVAPAAEAQASLFRNLDTTMRALNAVARPYIQDSITGGKPALDAGIESLPNQRPVPGQHRRPAARAAARRALAAHGRPGPLGRARRRHRGAPEDARAQPAARIAARRGADVLQRPARARAVCRPRTRS